MNYQLKLKNGVENIAFSMYFVNRVCKLANIQLNDVFEYLIGKNIKKEGDVINIKDGLLNDLEVRAVVLSASREAYEFSQKNYSVFSIEDGFNLMDEMDGGLLSSSWTDIYTNLLECIIPKGLPKNGNGEGKPAKKPHLKK